MEYLDDKIVHHLAKLAVEREEKHKEEMAEKLKLKMEKEE